MINKTHAISFLEKVLLTYSWVQTALKELNGTDVKATESMPMDGVVRDLRRILRQHHENTIKAGILTTGIAETLSILDGLAEEGPVTIMSFSSSKVTILLYSSPSTAEFYGCVTVYTKNSQPTELPAWVNR